MLLSSQGRSNCGGCLEIHGLILTTDLADTVPKGNLNTDVYPEGKVESVAG